MNTLSGKVAVVFGGTSGIGAAISELFAVEAARVVIAGRREAEGEAMAAALGARFVRADVTSEPDVAAVIADTVAHHGRVDALVNSAGEAGPGGSVADVDMAAFERTFAVHVGGVLLGMKHAAKIMLDQGTGSIINIASTSGRLAGWSGLGYSAAKAAVLHLTRTAAVELGERGVRVNSISPGPIPTGIFAKGAGMDPSDADRTAPALESVFSTALRDHQPIGRTGRPTDVAAAALWLASDASSFVTGHDLVVDGGISAGRPASVALTERAELARAFANLVRSDRPH